MKYGSVCSGIEAASVAWEPLGWEPAWFSEIEKFPSQVLAHRWPSIPNLGDMTLLTQNDFFNATTIDLLVGGTPCQSFSIAGLRGGLADDRGNLALEYCRLLIAKRPRWFVWENVPGVLTSFSHEAGSDKGEQRSDFATLLEAFQECGYSVAWRVFDSQYFGVPQRRRRVFVVGYLGDNWRPPFAVLFERESLRRDFTPRRKEGQEVAGCLDARTKGGGFPGTDGACSGHVVPMSVKGQITHTLRARTDSAVRKLTPIECERLQGFPDNYTNIPGAKDSPRYKALGNSMTVNVMHWIGARIDRVDKILKTI